jgi:quinol monooxygenase YgiN
MTDGVVVIITFQTQPGRADVARRELKALIEQVVVSEPDCLGIDFHEDLDDETRILLHERWTSKAAYTGPHLQTPYITAFMERSTGFMTGPPAITFWRLVDEFPRR